METLPSSVQQSARKPFLLERIIEASGRNVFLIFILVIIISFFYF